MSRASSRRSPAPYLRRGPQAVALLLVVGLLGAMATQPTRQLLAQHDRVAGMAGELDRIERMNARLEAKIERLQDPDYIEQKAREQAGLVRPGEVPYVVMPPSADKVAERKAEARRRKAAAEPEPQPGLIESFLDFVGFI